jgi:toxin FitB
MNYLLDTNVISELVRKKPNPNVVNWFSTLPNEVLYISVLTIGEIRFGIENITATKRKEKLKMWLELDLPELFENRVLPIDKCTTEKWGILRSQIQRPVPAIDSLLAATALTYDLCLVTRNIRDFQFPELKVTNPWC